MTRKQLVVAVSLSLSLAASVAAETIVISEPEVRTIVVKEGYADPISVVREGDMWRVKSVRTNSPGEVTVFVDAEGRKSRATFLAHFAPHFGKGALEFLSNF